jgi:hypothetical protein
MFVELIYLASRSGYSLHGARSQRKARLFGMDAFSIVLISLNDARQRAALTLDVVLLSESGEAMWRLDSDGVVVAKCSEGNEDDRGGTRVVSCWHRQDYALQLDDSDGRGPEHVKRGARFGVWK